MTNDSPPSAPRKLLPLVKRLLLLLLLIFIARRAFQLWESAPKESVTIQWLWLLPAGVAYAFGWLPSVWLWRRLMHEMHQPVPLMMAIRAYYIGHVGKYVPGKALVLLIRGSLLADRGINPVLGGFPSVYKTLIFMATCAAIAIGAAPVALGNSFWSQVPDFLHALRQPVWLFPTLVAVVTFATTPLSAWLFTVLGRRTLPVTESSQPAVRTAITAVAVAQGVLACSIGWLLHSISLGLVLQSVSADFLGPGPFWVWVEACTLSTVGGFVVLIAPGGIGVREGLLIEVLKDQPHIGPTIAFIAAALLRTAWFTTEILLAAVFYCFSWKTSRSGSESTNKTKSPLNM